MFGNDQIKIVCCIPAETPYVTFLVPDPGSALQCKGRIWRIAFRQVDWGDLVQHLAKCSSTAMQQWCAHCLFTGWISHSYTASDCWATSTTETNEILPSNTHTTPPALTHSFKLHKSISAKVYAKVKLLPTHESQDYCLTQKYVCSFQINCDTLCLQTGYR